MKTHLKGELSTDLLGAALHTRFSELFAVAARKSVFLWSESPLDQAQVVMLDASSNLLRLQPLPPCVIWLGYEQPAAGFSDAWVGRLAQDHTVADLIDILDRAAVFLLDWKARQPATATAGQPPAATSVYAYERSFAHSTIQHAAPAALGSAAMATAQGSRYLLDSWVFLGVPFDSAGCIGALALLARQPVTTQQLRTHSGLAPAELGELLKELARRKVLQVIAPAHAVTPLSSAPASRGLAPVHKGLVRRLSQWLSRASRP
ncbi:MAG: hypothetical protein ACK41V_10930 [Acidovorax sp.]|uniref:hypothetical protein n=1 Tax=Acidovorax sp. TaxID=1872122 RepID=UPI00391AC5D7